MKAFAQHAVRTRPVRAAGNTHIHGRTGHPAVLLLSGSRSGVSFGRIVDSLDPTIERVD
jgi:hypothetical protein